MILGLHHADHAALDWEVMIEACLRDESAHQSNAVNVFNVFNPRSPSFLEGISFPRAKYLD